jgi:F-type H+-transporting ATPase subunit b
VNTVLEKRQSAITADYDKAAAAKEEAEKLQAEYTVIMQNSKEEASSIVKDASAKATRRSDEILLQAKNDADAIREKANLDIERERKLAKSQLKDEISELAVEVASKIVEKEVKKEDHDKLITEFLETVGEV